VVSTVAEPEATDRDLLGAYRAGRPGAFDALYARHRDPLYLHARALTRDDAWAEDAVHETFLRLVQAGDPRLAGSGSLSPFLHTTLRRIVIDRHRSRTAAVRREQAVGERWIRPSDPAADPAQVAELDAALRRLPPEQLEAVLLHIYGGMTFQEVADAVDAPLKTIISRYGYALDKLAHMLGGEPE